MTVVDGGAVARRRVRVCLEVPRWIRSLGWQETSVERLLAQRQILIRAWSEKTIYRGSATAPQGQANVATPSFGQCGVSSAWLLGQFSWPRRQRAKYCVGYVSFNEGRPDRSDLHCWIEIGGKSSTKRLVIDVTCDQFDRLSGIPVLRESHQSLLGRSIKYQADVRMRFGQLRNDSVWKRYTELKRELLAADPGQLRH
ncbi:hypothetical protein ACWGID_03030 [Kribbella sp. NPDC054772]